MEDTQFKTVITGKHKILDLHLREILRYRDLIFLFVKRDFISLYKQTILGPLWAIIQPLLTTVMFTIIFGNMAKLTTADAPGNFTIPGFLFYMAGSICWTFFSSVVDATSNTFLRNQSIMGKVYYPRIITPIATALSQLIAFGIQFGLFIIIWIIILLQGGSSIRITPYLLLIPLLILQIMILSVGCGIVISSVTTKYRDLRYLVSFGLQLWQFGSPIAYGLQMVPKNSLGLYLLNPIATIVTAFRRAVFGFGFFDLRYYLVSWVFTLLVFFIGIILFSRIERTFTDTI